MELLQIVDCDVIHVLADLDNDRGQLLQVSLEYLKYLEIRRTECVKFETRCSAGLE
jgi:hypothetical protein